MKYIRRTLFETEPEWALTGRDISLWRQSVIEWSAPPLLIMKRICAGNVFVLLHPSSALLPFLTPFSFLPLNKSFVGAENGDNFTSLQSASHRVISVTSKWWCIKKGFGESCLKVFSLETKLCWWYRERLSWSTWEINYHTSFCSHTQNDNGWTMSILNHQVVYRLSVNVFHRFFWRVLRNVFNG